MANYDLGLFKGHGQGDCGAVGNGYQEHERASVLVDKIAVHLKAKGLNVHTAVNNYVNVYPNSNTYSKKFALSIHLNSATDSSAVGSEILVPCGEKYLDQEVEILKGLENLGFRNRGLKSRDYDSEAWYQRSNGTALSGKKDYYKEIRTAWNKGVSLSILEICFISNKGDIDRFNANIDKIALIIANAILKTCGLAQISAPTPTPPPSSTNNSNVLYRVMCGSFGQRANAEKRIAELKAKGFEATIMIYEK